MKEFKLNKFYAASSMNMLLLILVPLLNLNSDGFTRIAGTIFGVLILCIAPLLIASVPKNNKLVQALFDSKKYMYVLACLYVPAVFYLFTMKRAVILFFLALCIIYQFYLFIDVFTSNDLSWRLLMADDFVSLNFGRKSLNIKWENIESIETYTRLSTTHICLIPKDESSIEGKFMLIDTIRNFCLKKKIISFPEHILVNKKDDAKILLKSEFERKREKTNG